MRNATPLTLSKYGNKGFTLIELLVCIAVIAILIALSATSFTSIGRSLTLTSETNQLSNYLDLARQKASTLNRTVEVRFYKLQDAVSAGSQTYRAVQLFVVNIDGSISPLSKILLFPPGMRIASNPGLSSLMNLDEFSGTSLNYSINTFALNYSCRALDFLPNQSVISKGTTQCTTISVFIYEMPDSSGSDPSASALPKNWASIQINTISGRIKCFRP